MIDYDYIHALSASVRNFLHIGNSTIHSNDKGAENFLKVINGIFVEAVRVGSAGKPPAHINSDGSEVIVKQGRRAYSVNIPVTENKDFFSLFLCL